VAAFQQLVRDRRVGQRQIAGANGVPIAECTIEGMLTRPELLRVTPNAGTDLGTDSAQEQRTKASQSFEAMNK
jgi:hypothetical protein